MSDRTGRRAAALFLGKPLQADVDIVIDAPDALDAPGVGGVVGDAEGGDAAGGDATGGDGKKGYKTVTIPAHSSYLAARCEYFSAALGRSWQQTALGARGDCLSVGEAPASKARRLGLPLPGVTRRAVMAVLEYLYTDHVVFPTQRDNGGSNGANNGDGEGAYCELSPVELLVTADRLGLRRLVSLCELQVTKVCFLKAFFLKGPLGRGGV